MDDLSRIPAQSKAEVIRIVKQTKQRSGWPAHRALAALGVPRSVYYGWLRRESLEDRAGAPCRVYEALPEEHAAICEFALRYPKIGYRKLTWMMVDEQVVCVGESTVYRVLSEANLLSRWKRSERSSGEYHFRPSAPNQQWHTDVMYVWVAARFYFLLSFVDAFSRYVVHHRLLMTLDGRSVATELQAALEANQGIEPRIVHDHGSEFVNRDVAAVIKAHNLIDIKTRPRHPPVQWHRGAIQRHCTRCDRQRLRHQLLAGRSDHGEADAALQRGTSACHAGIHDASHMASWQARRGSRGARAANRCGPCAPENDQSAAVY